MMEKQRGGKLKGRKNKGKETQRQGNTKGRKRKGMERTTIQNEGNP